MQPRSLSLALTALCFLGCNSFDNKVPEPDVYLGPTPTSSPNNSNKLFQGKPVVRSERAAPISGGSLYVSRDGTTAVAADTDRDRIFIVDLASQSVQAAETLPEDGLGRVIEGPAGVAYAVARRAGQILEIDLASATVARRFPVCRAPNGLAYDGASRLHVACRSGSLVSLDVATGSVVGTIALDEDLRDVLLKGTDFVVTRFRTAEVMVVDSAGTITARDKAEPTSLRGAGQPSVAFRAVPHPNGSVVMAHFISSDTPLGTGFGAYYGGACGAVVDPVLSVVDPDPPVGTVVDGNVATVRSMPISSATFHNLAGPLDVAVSPDGSRIALLGSGNAWHVDNLERPAVFLVESADRVGKGTAPVAPSCGSGGVKVSGEPVAVAFDSSAQFVVQSREPAQLELEDGTVIPLSDVSHEDTGMAMFHMNTSGGMACTSCHPEGVEDGHTWSFTAFGLRRTQALAGGVGLGAPFHWSGDLATFEDLMNEVMIKRMALPVGVTAAQSASLLDWLGRLEAPPTADGLDEQAVARGQVLFQSTQLACFACHSGPMFTDDMLHDVGTGGEFVTPSLIGVGLRAPLMHDGCATSLKARFGACGGGDAHGATSRLNDTEMDDLVAFLRSL